MDEAEAFGSLLDRQPEVPAVVRMAAGPKRSDYIHGCRLGRLQRNPKVNDWRVCDVGHAHIKGLE